MPLEAHDKVIEGAVHSCPFLVCEVCHEKLTDLADGLVFWTPFAKTQVAFCHKRCRGAFSPALYHRELGVFLAQLVRTLRPPKAAEGKGEELLGRRA